MLVSKLQAAAAAVLVIGAVGMGGAMVANEVLGQDPPAMASLSPATFEQMHAMIKPQAGESRWAAIPWMYNLERAREKAAAEDKPLLVWRAGGGDVLGRA